ncbi:PAS domain-containing protein [Roseobacter sp. CCS2]|uniref:PAS domain-containing protein n=1 Tax=Roseobacter sp. CCS2 TaxID=391593 RepID=UPI0000F3E4A3|nr:PAS domain-containing protein [Roseobacter sp. CCS2]EBA12411.1 PAS domain containing protein [Roseobacter sp. CCS2]
MSSIDVPQVIHDFFEASQIPLALSDPNLPEDSLILANSPFYRMTGFGPTEALGKNCRFLQGPNTQKHVRKTIAGDLMANRDSQVLIRNYRKSGEQFDNFLFIFTILDSKGAPLFRIGSQFEVPHIDRNPKFEAHTTALRAGFEKINTNADIAQQQLVDTGALVGLTVKKLLTARLDALKYV